MQFSVVAIVAAFAATVSAQYGNNTAPFPTGTGSPHPSTTTTGTPPPFTGAAVANAGSALAVLAAGGVALVSVSMI